MEGCREEKGKEAGTEQAHLLDLQAVGEGLDAQLGEQRCLRGTDLVADLDQLHVGRDFDRALVDLGGDVQRLLRGTRKQWSHW